MRSQSGFGAFAAPDLALLSIKVPNSCSLQRLKIILDAPEIHRADPRPANVARCRAGVVRLPRGILDAHLSGHLPFRTTHRQSFGLFSIRLRATDQKPISTTATVQSYWCRKVFDVASGSRAQPLCRLASKRNWPTAS